jgi:hypothetical protein
VQPLAAVVAPSGEISVIAASNRSRRLCLSNRRQHSVFRIERAQLARSWLRSTEPGLREFWTPNGCTLVDGVVWYLKIGPVDHGEPLSHESLADLCT